MKVDIDVCSGLLHQYIYSVFLYVRAGPENVNSWRFFFLQPPETGLLTFFVFFSENYKMKRLRDSLSKLPTVDSQRPVAVYLGNEAGDLDSGFLFKSFFFTLEQVNRGFIACCAIAMSYAETQRKRFSVKKFMFLEQFALITS